MNSRRQRSQPVALQASMALVSCCCILNFAIMISAFQPPSSTNHHIISPQYDISSTSRYNNGISSRRSSTSLNMVFDFFKKAQDSANEQMSAFATGLAKSRNQFLYSLEDIGSGGTNLLDDLEDTLLQADLGMATTDDVLSEARFLREESTEIFSREDIKALLRGKLIEALGASAGGSTAYNRVQEKAGKELKSSSSTEGESEEEGSSGNSFTLKFASEDDPKPVSAKKPLSVHFIMGANGMGKTTTIGKLAHRLKTEANQKVLLAACDTFRAGAVAQLEQWADRAEVDCFSPTKGTNGPSAVLYGAIDKAIAEQYDVLLVDTSGRLSNNDALTAELVKMKRVIQKKMSTGFDEQIKPIPNLNVPHETLLVIDAAQGRMALDSAKQWDKELGLSGLILTKLDGSAKGGSVVAVSRELGLPVKLVGVGEGMEDLKDVSLTLRCCDAYDMFYNFDTDSFIVHLHVSFIQFEPESFVDSLLGIGIAGGGTSKGEGKALASRLTQMRKERNERAKTATKKETVASSSSLGIGGPAGQMTLQGLEDIGGADLDMGEMELVTPDGSGGGGRKSSGKGKNNNKKKKKRKKKK